MDREDLRDNIRMVLPPEVSDISDTLLNGLINQSLLEISVSAKWPFLHASTTVTTVADQEAYNLPADFLYGESLVDDDHDDNLEYISPAKYFEFYGNATQASTTTTATVFTIWQDQLLLYPTPSAADTNRYTLYYYGAITALSQDTDEPGFLEGFHWICVDWVKWHLYEREGMVQEAERAFIMYANHLERMKSWYMNQMKQAPWIAGDGYHRRIGDPNLPILNFVQ